MPSGSGSFPFTIKVTDPQGLSNTQSWNVTVAGDISDQPPAVNPSGIAPQSKASVGRLYEQMIDDNFTDPDGDTLHFSPVGTWPAGMTLSDTGDIEWTPTAAEITDPGGTGTNPYHLTVQANDDRGGTANYSFDVSVGYYKPDAPYAVSVKGVEVGEGGGVRIVWANDPNTDVTGYNVYRVNPGSTTPQLLNLTPIPRVLGVSPSFLDTTPILAEQSATYYITALSDTDGHSFESDPSNVLTWTVNGPLTVAQPATATPNPVTGTTTQLSVLGDENGSDSGLNYNWSMLSGPAPVTFSDAENDNSAKNEVVTFTNAGSYQFQVTVTDINNQSVTSEIAVTVQQTPTSISISPTAVTLPPSTTSQTSVQQFTAYVFDQFGNTMSDPLTWSCNGDGSIDSSTGLYTAPESGNGATITVSADGLSAQAEVMIGTPGPITAQVTSTADINLTWDFDANADSYIIYRSTDPNFIADGSNAITATSNGVGQYTDDDLAAGTTYYYEIDEVASDGVSSSVVGTTSATTFAQDTPLVGEAMDTNSVGPVTQVHFVNPSPTNVRARGVNDTTVYVAWQNHALNATHNIVQESDGNGGWFQVASTPENVHGCMIRNLQVGGQYSFRVIAANAFSTNSMYSTSSPSMPSQPVSPIVPSFDNMIYLIGGHLQTEADLEGSVDGDAALGVGVIFWDLVASGYNPYLTAEASGSGPLENLLGWNWNGIINWDGSGEAENDIKSEWANGTTTSGDQIKTIGLVGYSHGASIAEHLSNRIFNDMGGIGDNVAFAGTIDSVERYQDDWPFTTGDGPDTTSPGDPDFGWAADTLNYWQPHPYPIRVNSLGPHGQFQIHGAPMILPNGGENIPVPFVGGGTMGKPQSHVTIDKDIYVLQGIQDGIADTWGQTVYQVNQQGNHTVLDPWYYAGGIEPLPSGITARSCFYFPS